MKTFRLAVLGGGNMGGALVGGLLAARVMKPGEIAISEPDAARRRSLAKKFGVKTLADNGAAAAQSQTVALAVKPQQMAGVLSELAGRVGPKHLLISVAAGVRTDAIEAAVGPVPVVRVMPNTPALLRAGAMVYALGARAKAKDEAAAKKILAALGPVWKAEESWMDAVTALSGSGPAYVFRLSEAMAAAGAALGLPATLAEALARQTVYGAGRMLAETAEPAAELRRKVTSPGGTTEAALKALEAGDFEGLFRKALGAARRRSEELSRPK